MSLWELISKLSKLQNYFSYWPIYCIANFCITPSCLYKDYSISNFCLSLFINILGSHQNTYLCQYSLGLFSWETYCSGIFLWWKCVFLVVLLLFFYGMIRNCRKKNLPYLPLKPFPFPFHWKPSIENLSRDRTLEKFGKCFKCQYIYVYIYIKIIVMAVHLCNVLSLQIIRRGKLIFLIWFIRLFMLFSEVDIWHFLHQ